MVVKRDLVTESMNPYEKPPDVSRSQAIKNFMYNSETGAVLGRSASSWAKIGLFYLVFYGVLAALVAICFCGFFYTLSLTQPKWQLDRSIIGTNPGLGFRPMPPDENVESTLIWFKGSDEKNYKHWVDSLTKFLEEYRKPRTAARGENVITCSYSTEKPPDKVCVVAMEHWRYCIKEDDYGYRKSSPCVFLKLNKIFGWIPEFYNSSIDLPENMPNSLKQHISDVEHKDPQELNTIWVSCDGENPADQEHIGPIHYVPRQGFPGYYYPFKNYVGYLSPLVAIYFERPKTGILINIECKAWARNIIHNRHDRLGSVHFELLID